MKLLVISEYAVGSGYSTITGGLVGELGRRGHDVVVIAFTNKGGPHDLQATVVPTDEDLFRRQITMTVPLFKPDAVVVIMDVSTHHGMSFLQELPMPYIGIFPIEADPLIHPTKTTATIDTMEGCLCETRFGTQLLQEVGIRATYFPVGVDEFWRPPVPEQRRLARESRGLSDRFVILTVCDNHERKLLPAHYAAVSLLTGNEITWPVEIGRRRKLPRRKVVSNVYYIVNTKRRPGHLGKAVGYDNFNLVEQFGLTEHSMVLEHEHTQGLTPSELRELYWSADALLLLSKAEGLGLPVMEAQACGLPVVGTDCTGIKENLSGGRGFLVKPEYVHIDPFYNQLRRWPDPLEAALKLSHIAKHGAKSEVERSLAYIKEFTWQRSADVFEEVLNGACPEKKAGEAAEEGKEAEHPS